MHIASLKKYSHEGYQKGTNSKGSLCFLLLRKGLPPSTSQSTRQPPLFAALPQEADNLCSVLQAERVKGPRSQISTCVCTYNESKDSRRTWGSQFSLKGKTNRQGYG